MVNAGFNYSITNCLKLQTTPKTATKTPAIMPNSTLSTRT